MACVYCFFSNEYQYKLKESALGEPKFEVKLNKYKELYLKEIKKINSIENCNCSNNEKKLDKFIKFTNEFCKDIKENYTFIEEVFS